MRLAGLAAVAVMAGLRASGAALAWYLGAVVLLALSGWAVARLVAAEGRGARAGAAALIGAEMALIAAVLTVPAPGLPEGWPPAMELRLGNAGFLFLFLGFAALTTAPALALWAGLAAAAAWVGGALRILGLPGTFTAAPADFAGLDAAAAVRLLLDPGYVSMIAVGQEAALMALVGAIMATAAWRARRLARAAAAAAEGRARLSRYFSPDLAARLAAAPGGLDRVRRAEAAVLFADLKGFSRLAEGAEPEAVMALLRRFHALATAAVFAEGGTLHKFIGDEVMASFGAFSDGPDPEAAARALRAACAIADAVAAWSAEREAAGEAPVAVGVGLHLGPVAVGDVGDARCVELALLGDAVNLAARLERATRAHGADVAASVELLEAARAQGAAAEGFREVPAEPLRGREAATRYAVRGAA